jgi:hypothetical protein
MCTPWLSLYQACSRRALTKSGNMEGREGGIPRGTQHPPVAVHIGHTPRLCRVVCMHIYLRKRYLLEDLGVRCNVGLATYCETLPIPPTHSTHSLTQFIQYHILVCTTISTYIYACCGLGGEGPLGHFALSA